MSYHDVEVEGGIHVVANWKPADETARLALVLVAADVGKVAWQQDDDTLWLLTAITPTWVRFGNGGGVVYGSERHYAASDALSTTTSYSWVDKLQLDTSDLPSGTYRVEWSGEIYNSGYNLAWIQCERTTGGALEIGKASIFGYDDTEWFAQSGFWEGSLSGEHTFKIQYAAGANTTGIRKARISLIRVA